MRISNDNKNKYPDKEEMKKFLIVYMKSKGIYITNRKFTCVNPCFLQVKIPHFCKTFSPDTGGEFFRPKFQ